MHSKKALGMLRILRPLFLAILGLFATGCVPMEVRRSAVQWNLRDPLETTNRGTNLRVLQLLSRDDADLEKIMACYPSPAVDSLVGTWCGVNKGIGPAVAGLHQDVKVFKRCGNHIEGFNILVEQVRVEELASKGWRPKQSFLTKEPTAIGVFHVTTRCSTHHERSHVVLDYKQEENRVANPTRYLIDELVEVEPGLLLGKAYARFGTVEMPLAFFALQKGICQSDCDTLVHDSAVSTERVAEQ